MAEEGPKFSNVAADITVVVALLIIAIAFFGVFFNRVIDWYDALLDRLYAYDWNRVLNVLIVLNAALIGFGVYTIRNYFLTKRNHRTPIQELPIHIVAPKEEVRETWEQIQTLVQSSNPSDWNMAVIRADALLDDILRDLGYEGEALADRLKIVSPTHIPSLERIWSAHRLRNSIAHDPLEQHTREAIQYAVRTYEDALIELKLMEKQPGSATQNTA